MISSAIPRMLLAIRQRFVQRSIDALIGAGGYGEPILIGSADRISA
jgi:hypothetical protein